jgi:hypothetical protein
MYSKDAFLALDIMKDFVTIMVENASDAAAGLECASRA